MEFKEADRKDVKIKIGVGSLAGGGKTISSLLLMKGLLSNIEQLGVSQTEPGRAQLYKDKIGPFKVLEVQPPFTPQKFIEVIDTAEKAGLRGLIFDSLSDEWAGIGGALDMHTAASEVTKNSFTAWKKITPSHEGLFNRILASNLHIIGTFKKKSDYVIETNDKGKQVPKKVGLADIAREGTEYRWMLHFDIDRETHKAVATKDNTGLFDGKEPFLITEETGKLLRDWCLGKGE